MLDNRVVKDIIIISSVWHTGTMSLINLFKKEKPGYKFINKDFSIFKHESQRRRWFRKPGKYIIFGHIHPNSVDFIRGLSEISTLIIPMRDPLLSLISNYKRDNHRPKTLKNYNIGLFDQLETWVKYIFNLNSFHVPVDLDISKLEYNGVAFSKIGVYNSFGNSLLNEAYISKDKEYIISKLGDCYSALCDMENILRPSLEKLGYRNLLWWKDYE